MQFTKKIKSHTNKNLNQAFIQYKKIIVMDHQQNKIFQRTSLKCSIEIFLSIISIRNVLRKIFMILTPITTNTMQPLMKGANLNNSNKIYINRKTWCIAHKLGKIIKIKAMLICINKMCDIYQKENILLHKLMLA